MMNLVIAQSKLQIVLLFKKKKKKNRIAGLWWFTVNGYPNQNHVIPEGLSISRDATFFLNYTRINYICSSENILLSKLY